MVGCLESSQCASLNIHGQAERYIEKSGVNYTIVRPGGLSNKPPAGNLVMTGPVSGVVAYEGACTGAL